MRLPNSSACLWKAQWQRLSWILALLPALLVLHSCGGGNSSASTATPTITASCATSSLTVGGQTQCTATILNLSSTLVNWKATFGTIDSSGLYTAPGTQPTPSNVVTITATAQAQTTLTTTTTVTILPDTAINAITCLDATQTQTLNVTSGMSLACTATSSANTPIPVFWQVNTITGGDTIHGKISAQGNYVAPLVPPAGGTVTITAISQAVSTNTKLVVVAVTFGNRVLSGSYAFSTSGRLISGNTFFARAGSFTAGGDGTLVGNVEDYNQVGQSSGAVQRSFSGTYSVGVDGRGTMEFCENIITTCSAARANAFFRIVVISPQQAQIIEFSNPNTNPIAVDVGSGEMDLQDTSVFNKNGLSGVYSFGFSGLTAAAATQSEVGEFDADAVHGTILAGSASVPGRLDLNSGGPQFLPATTFSISSDGRGTVTLGSSAFSFYLVSSSRAKFIETDNSAVLVGDAFSQQASSPCSWGPSVLNGPVAFEVAGTDSTAGITELVSFAADGADGIVNASVDENSGGTVSAPARLLLTGSYSIDACGRGTLSIPATAPNRSYVFYMTSVGNAVIQDVTTATIAAHGTLATLQSQTLTAAALNGSYALNLEGTFAGGPTGNEVDVVGQITTSGTSTVQNGTVTAGSVDVNNTSADGGITSTGATEAGAFVVATASTPPVPSGARTTMTLTSPQNLVLYIVSPTQAFAMVGTDNTGIVAIGSLFRQF